MHLWWGWETWVAMGTIWQGAGKKQKPALSGKKLGGSKNWEHLGVPKENP